MTNHSPKDSDKLPEDEADARFERGIANALKMPHTPHRAASPLSAAASEALRRIRDERFDELAEYRQVIERLRADRLVLDGPDGPVLSERARALLGDA